MMTPPSLSWAKPNDPSHLGTGEATDHENAGGIAPSRIIFLEIRLNYTRP